MVVVMPRVGGNYFSFDSRKLRGSYHKKLRPRAPQRPEILPFRFYGSAMC